MVPAASPKKQKIETGSRRDRFGASHWRAVQRRPGVHGRRRGEVRHEDHTDGHTHVTFLLRFDCSADDAIAGYAAVEDDHPNRIRSHGSLHLFAYDSEDELSDSGFPHATVKSGSWDRGSK